MRTNSRRTGSTKSCSRMIMMMTRMKRMKTMNSNSKMMSSRMNSRRMLPWRYTCHRNYLVASHWRIARNRACFQAQRSHPGCKIESRCNS